MLKGVVCLASRAGSTVAMSGANFNAVINNLYSSLPHLTPPRLRMTGDRDSCVVETSRTVLGCIQSPLQCANGVSLSEGKVAGACDWLLISIECWDQWREVVLPLFCPLLWHVVLSATALTLIVALYDNPSPKASLTTTTATFWLKRWRIWLAFLRCPAETSAAPQSVLA